MSSEEDRPRRPPIGDGSSPPGPVGTETTSSPRIGAPGTSDRRALYTLGVLSLVCMLNYYDRNLISILMQPISVDLHLSDSELGLVSGLSFALVYSMAALPIARLADRFGPPGDRGHEPRNGLAGPRRLHPRYPFGDLLPQYVRPEPDRHPHSGSQAGSRIERQPGRHIVGFRLCSRLLLERPSLRALRRRRAARPDARERLDFMVGDDGHVRPGDQLFHHSARADRRRPWRRRRLADDAGPDRRYVQPQATGHGAGGQWRRR